MVGLALESSRGPLDFSESESELVAGYTTEYGGFLFGVYYLGEYLHLFFFSLLLSTLIFGGWELPRFTLIIVYTYFDTLLGLDTSNITASVYTLDESFLSFNVYYGLILYYYFYFVYEFIINTYEIMYCIYTY